MIRSQLVTIIGSLRGCYVRLRELLLRIEGEDFGGGESGFPGVRVLIWMILLA